MITASLKIAGIARPVSDIALTPLLDSGASTKSNFRSLLDQLHPARESDTETDDTQASKQHNENESDPTRTLVAVLPLTQTVEAPRLILPLASSIKPSPDGATEQDPSASAPAPAPDDKLQSLSFGVISMSGKSGSASDLKLLSRNLKTVSAIAHTQQNIDSLPTRPGTTDIPAEHTAETAPPTPTFSSFTTAKIAANVQMAGTVQAARDSVTVSAPTLDRATIIVPSARSAGRDTKPVDTTNRKPQEISDSTLAFAVPLPATPAAEIPQWIRPLSSPSSSGQDGAALPSRSTAKQEFLIAPESDPPAAPPPTVEHAEDTTPAPNAGALAFAARLNPATELPPPAPELTRAVDSLPRSQTPLQLGNPVATKQITALPSELPTDSHGGEGGGPADKEKGRDWLATPEALLPQVHAPVANQPVIAANNHVAADISGSPLSPAARMDQLLDPPAVAPNTNHDITVRIPDSTEQGTAIRFVERAGEVHVSVRTGDVEMAQTLRGGLNDLVNRLEDGGIQTEVWQPGAGSNSSSSQNDSHHPFADPDGSQGRQDSSGSDRQQQSGQQNKPRWVEQLEGPVGNQTFKEITKLAWQA